MKITIKNLQEKIPISPIRIKKTILRTLTQEKKRLSGEITVCLLNDRQIRELNLFYLAQDTPTDVLSFEVHRSKSRIVADIAVSVQTAVRNARIFKTSPLYEVCLYVIHGMLHLLGYDDRTISERKIIDRESRRILETLHVTRHTLHSNHVSL